MLTTINFLNLPFLTPSYENVIDFKSKANRNNYFQNRVQLTIDNCNIKYDSNRTYVIVEKSLEQLSDYDYLYFSSGDRTYFYFILSAEYNTPNTTMINLELDVFNTYYYDCTINSSFVDRMHVDRWNGDLPTYNLEDEGLSIGEYIITEDPVEICKMESTLIIATSAPLGVTTTSKGGSGGDSSDSTGSYGGTSWKDGKISSKGFRFIKGFEGFAPNAYQDSGGYWTIAYGVTKHGEPTIYNDLVSKAPVSEEEGAKVSYELKNKNYASKILQSCKDMGVTEQYQFDALVSVAYNCGNGAVTGDNTLTRAISTDIADESTIRSVWESFKITSNGVTQPGLVARRKEECNMFFNKSYEIRSISLIDSSGGISGTVTENNGDGWLPDDTSYEVDGSGEEYDGHKVTNNDFGNGWLIPVKGATVSSPYGWRNCPYHGREMHNGVDLACSTGTAILAPKSGTVIKVGFHDSMGNYTKICHNVNGEDIITIYMHQSKIIVKEGDTVKRTQKIGEVGSTGDSTGPHLHWEFRNSDNESVTPIPGASKGTKY